MNNTVGPLRRVVELYRYGPGFNITMECGHTVYKGITAHPPKRSHCEECAKQNARIESELCR